MYFSHKKKSHTTLVVVIGLSFFCIRYFMGCSKENGYSIPRRKEKDYWLVVREKTHCSKSDSFVHKYISTQKSRGKSSKNPRKIREKKNPKKKILKNLGKNYQKIRIFNLEKTFSDKKLSREKLSKNPDFQFGKNFFGQKIKDVG